MTPPPIAELRLDADYPEKIYATRHGDDEPVNGMWLDCGDPEAEQVEYVRRDIHKKTLLDLADKAERYERALHQIMGVCQEPWDSQGETLAYGVAQQALAPEPEKEEGA